MSLSEITMSGNVTADPELRFTASGTPVTQVRIASTERKWDAQANGHVDGDTVYLDATVWKKSAEYVAESLHKGMKVLVTGRLKQRSYETREGEKRTVYEIDAKEIGVALTFGSVTYHKGGRGGGQQQQGGSFGGQQQGGFGGQQQQGGWGNAQGDDSPF